MHTSVEFNDNVKDVRFTDTSVCLALKDGREICAPLTWFSRLDSASAEQRSNWQLIGDGMGVHWPDVDEDISVKILLSGHD